MRRPNATNPIGFLARTLPVLALAVFCFAAGRLTAPSLPPTTSRTVPAPMAAPAPDTPVTSAAPATPSLLEPLPGLVHTSECDVARAAEEAWRGRDPLTGPVLYRVRVLRVVDGDTIRVRWHGEDVAVRLLRIDAPEVGQPGYREATAHLIELIAGDWIDLEFEDRTPTRDRYGRLLAYLRKDDRNLNVEMVHGGYVVFYVRYGVGKHEREFR